MMATGFQRDVECSVVSALTGFLQCEYLSVRAAVFAMCALADDFSVANDDGTHEWIGVHAPKTLFGKFKRQVHPALVALVEAFLS